MLKKTDTGYVFEYLPEYISVPDAKPISLSMPIREKKFESARLFPFFEGLLPEGWLLDITSKTLKINKKDKFEMLLHVGRDTIGAVSVIPQEEIEE
ncbi:MAG: HipA N-terminal domain-containing protein [Elusimicrobia bacterium]|nr:HipA N-terminal domain-containing protein [Elusimicrobiota bacterium]